jgi:drug/metabolite transporter (DMT)-like permease
MAQCTAYVARIASDRFIRSAKARAGGCAATGFRINSLKFYPPVEPHGHSTEKADRGECPNMPLPKTQLPAANAATVFHRIWNAPVLLLVVAVLFWAGNVVVARGVSGSVPPVALAFWRWSGAFALVLAIAGGQLRRDMPAMVRNWRAMLVLTAFGIAAYNTLLYVGLQSTTAVNASLMQSAMPVLIIASGFLLFRERVSLLQIGAVLTSVAGVLVIAGRGSLDALLSLSFNTGDLWVFVAVITYAIYSTLLRKRPAIHPLSFLGATFALGALMLLPFYLYEHQSGQEIKTSVATLTAMTYTSVFPGFLAYLFFNRGVALVGANRAGQFMHLIPVFGSILAVIFLGERLYTYHVLGIVLIAAGLLVAGFAKAPAK